MRSKTHNSGDKSPVDRHRGPVERVFHHIRNDSLSSHLQQRGKPICLPHLYKAQDSQDGAKEQGKSVLRPPN